MIVDHYTFGGYTFCGSFIRLKLQCCPYILDYVRYYEREQYTDFVSLIKGFNNLRGKRKQKYILHDRSINDAWDALDGGALDVKGFLERMKYRVGKKNIPDSNIFSHTGEL